MLTKIRQNVDHLVKTKSLRDEAEVYTFVTLEMATAFSALSYLGLILVYGFAGLPLMAALNVLCMLAMLAALWLCYGGRQYYAAGTIMVLVVLVYGTASHLLTGFNTFNITYIILGASTLLVIPFSPRPFRAVIGVLYIASGLYIAVGSFYGPAPVFAMAKAGAVSLAVYNVLVGLLGMAFELTVVSTVKQALADHAENKLDDMINKANSDTLTGLYNRRYAHIYFDNLMRSPAGEVWCVAMLDVDNFKHLNDEYGHLAGDKVLASLADMMRQVLRSTDNIFRWGGEEFLLVLKGTSLQNATSVLERMLKIIAETPIDAEGHTLYITATVGVTVLDLKNVQGSIDKCDARLYIGKRSGKNKVVSTG